MNNSFGIASLFYKVRNIYDKQTYNYIQLLELSSVKALIFKRSR